MMLTWWVSALWPRLALRTRAAIALGLCYAVELTQLCHTPGLDALRRTSVGHLVLGSGFDLRDLAAYALGVLAAVVIERMVASRGRARGQDSDRSPSDVPTSECRGSRPRPATARIRRPAPGNKKMLDENDLTRSVHIFTHESP
jgi:hypothetical protein